MKSIGSIIASLTGTRPSSSTPSQAPIASKTPKEIAQGILDKIRADIEPSELRTSLIQLSSYSEPCLEVAKCFEEVAERSRKLYEDPEQTSRGRRSTLAEDVGRTRKHDYHDERAGIYMEVYHCLAKGRWLSTLAPEEGESIPATDRGGRIDDEDDNEGFDLYEGVPDSTW